MTEDKRLEVDAGREGSVQGAVAWRRWKNWLRLAAQPPKEHALVRSEGCGDERVQSIGFGNQSNHHTATGRAERSEVTGRQEESTHEALAGASEGRTVSLGLPINTLLQVGSATSTVRATLRQSETKAHSLPASILGQEQNSYLCSWKGSELIFFSKEQRKQM